MGRNIKDFLQGQINVLKDDKTYYKYLNLENELLGNIGTQELTNALNDVKVEELNLRNNAIGCDGLICLVTILPCFQQLNKLDLSVNVIGDKGICHLSDILKETRISTLNLNTNDIGNCGVECLSQVLKKTQITELLLNGNRIADEGAKRLSEVIQYTNITRLELGATNIGTIGAKALNLAVKASKVLYFYLEVNFPFPRGFTYFGLTQNSPFGCQDIEIKLKSNSIGMQGALYINETYKTTGITCLSLHNDKALQENDIPHLKQAFEGVKICQYKLAYKHLLAPRGVEFLIDIFKDSKIISLNMCGDRPISTLGAIRLALLLHNVKIIDLNLNVNCIQDEGVNYLAPILQTNSIMYINLAGNNVSHKGVYCLSKFLGESSILQLDLSNNRIGDEGAEYLVDGLLKSQVTQVNLKNCNIQLTGYQYIRNVIDKTHCVDIDDLRNLTISTKNVSVGSKIVNDFTNVVQQDTSGNYKFVLPTNDSVFRIETYPFLIQLFVEQPNSKVHIFDALCKIQCDNYVDFDLDKMSKIDEFINEISQKFRSFFESRVTNLVLAFNNVEYFVHLLKQFDIMGQTDMVVFLLKHREVFYLECGAHDFDDDYDFDNDIKDGDVATTSDNDGTANKDNTSDPNKNDNNSAVCKSVNTVANKEDNPAFNKYVNSMLAAKKYGKKHKKHSNAKKYNKGYDTKKNDKNTAPKTVDKYSAATKDIKADDNKDANAAVDQANNVASNKGDNNVSADDEGVTANEDINGAATKNETASAKIDNTVTAANKNYNVASNKDDNCVGDEREDDSIAAAVEDNNATAEENNNATDNATDNKYKPASNKSDNNSAAAIKWKTVAANKWNTAAANDVNDVGNNVPAAKLDNATANKDNDKNTHFKILHPYIYLVLDEYQLLVLEPNEKRKIVSFFQNHLEMYGAKAVINVLLTKY